VDDPFLCGKKYAILLSDNNYLQFKVLPHLLGLMENEGTPVAIPAVTRMPKEDVCMLLKREHSNADFAKTYNTINWGDIMAPMRSNQK